MSITVVILMNKYRVRMVRDTSQSVDIIVTADNPDEAENKAWNAARSNLEIKWDEDEGYGEPYCPDYNDDIELLQPGHPVSDGSFELREE